jgi:hypothetical protein
MADKIASSSQNSLKESIAAHICFTIGLPCQRMPILENISRIELVGTSFLSKAGILDNLPTMAMTSSVPAKDDARTDSDQLTESAITWSMLGAKRMTILTDRLAWQVFKFKVYAGS